jgi:pSer/pThr/pTyr-binding forkhead associated (FHA) protein
MSYLQVGGRRHPVPVGDAIIGSDPSSLIPLTGEGVLGQHAIVQGLPSGQVAIRLGAEGAEVLVNGVRLGPQPHPLLHGDKVEIGGEAILFVDERRSGSTQYVQAMDPSDVAAKPAKRVATSGTGGRLVSLTDGREYVMADNSLTIGRDASCDVVLTSKNVSRRHAEVISSPKGYVLVDSSTNGTIVNGKRISGQHVLARGDVIQCGEYDLRFYADVAQEAPPPVEGPAAPGAPWMEAPAMPPPGAEHRLSNTLHGVPGIRVQKPGAAPATKPKKAASEPPPTPRASASTGVLANLLVRSGTLRGRRFSIKVPVVNVGRADYNDIALPEESVSTTHAKLQRREGIWMLVDLESTNGTMVDGQKVEGEVPLAPGALIRFGDVQTIFEPTDDTIDPKKGSSTKIIDSIKEVAAVSGSRKATTEAPPPVSQGGPPSGAKPVDVPDRATEPLRGIDVPRPSAAARRDQQRRPSRPPPEPEAPSGGLPWWLFIVIVAVIVLVAIVFLGAS